MKNLFFVSAVFCILTATSLTATAQKLVKFIDGIEINQGINASNITTSVYEEAKIPAVKNIDRLATPKAFLFTEECKAFQFKYAQILKRDVELLTNTALFNFIDEWWETHYQYGGTTNAGIDCSAFAGLLLSAVYNLKLPRTAREEYAACEKIHVDDMQEGDLVFFNTRGGVSHVGIYLGEGYFVHASVTNGVTINNLDDKYYGKKFIGGGRPMHYMAKTIIN